MEVVALAPVVAVGVRFSSFIFIEWRRLSVMVIFEKNVHMWSWTNAPIFT